jgi:hypothetical protein
MNEDIATGVEDQLKDTTINMYIAKAGTERGSLN